LSLIANLVQERPGFEFNNYNFKLRRTMLDAGDFPRPTEYDNRPTFIASEGGLDESMD
jgi:hypothetical protein